MNRIKKENKNVRNVYKYIPALNYSPFLKQNIFPKSLNDAEITEFLKKNCLEA